MSLRRILLDLSVRYRNPVAGREEQHAVIGARQGERLRRGLVWVLASVVTVAASGGASAEGFAGATYGHMAMAASLRPVLRYATSLGLAGNSQGLAIAVGGRGLIYVAGANSAEQSVVMTLDPRSQRKALCMRLPVRIAGLAVDRAGDAYITGVTSSHHLRVVHPFQARNRGGSDAFVVKVSRKCKLIYSTYLGGHGYDGGTGIAVDHAGNAYVSGITYSADYPVRHALYRRPGGKSGVGMPISDAFVTKLSPVGRLVYSTYLGGRGNDMANGIAVNASGEAYVTGLTSSRNFPTVAPLQRALYGGADAFISRLNAAGNRLLYSTYFGGGGIDWGTAIALDTAGRIYLAGSTSSRHLPRASAHHAYGGSNDAFVAQFDTTGRHVLYCLYLGGRENDSATGIAVDRAGRVYVTGYTNSRNFPAVNALQYTLGAGTCGVDQEYRLCFDAFVTTLNKQGQIIYSTYIGGNGDDKATGIAVDQTGGTYATGTTASSDFPYTRGAVHVRANSISAFVVEIRLPVHRPSS
jgi:hypothetical protein